MKKPPTRKPAPKAPMIRVPEPDAVRVAFLYGDLGLDQRTIARLLKTSIGAVERCVKAHTLVRHRPPHGPWSETLVQAVASRLGLPLPDLTKVAPEDVWTKLRVALRTDLPTRLTRDPKVWFFLDGFLAELPHRQAAARDRLTRTRLALLHGDLGMQAPEIARVLDASWTDVRAALDRETLHRNQMVHKDLDEEALTTLAHVLGRDEWPIGRFGDYYRYDRRWSIVRKGVSEGLLQLAAARRLDLAALDQFIASIPKLAAERRARLLSKTPAKRTVAATKKAA